MRNKKDLLVSFVKSYTNSFNMDKKYESHLLIKKNLLREYNFFWLQMSGKNERRSSTKSASGKFSKMVSASESAVFLDERERERKRTVF